MPKTTAADRKALRAEEEKKAALKKAAFAATLPLKLLLLMARAEDRSDVTYAVHNPEGGDLQVAFSFHAAGRSVDRAYRGDDDFRNDDSNDADVRRLYLTSEEWEVQGVDAEFETREAADRERARLRQVAKDAWELLSEEQRTALGVRRPF